MIVRKVAFSYFDTFKEMQEGCLQVIDNQPNEIVGKLVTMSIVAVYTYRGYLLYYIYEREESTFI